MGTTTIQITDEQRDELESRKLNDNEPVKSVVGRLLEGDNSEKGDVDTDEIVDQIKNDLSMVPDLGVDEEAIVNQIVGRIDDLETELKTTLEGLR